LSAKEKSGAGLPTFVVPGWGAPFWHTEWMGRKLEEQGFSVWKLKLPFMGVGSMMKSAEQLGREIDHALEESGASRVNLVGYSMGGLISRIYLQDFGGSLKLGRALFLGSPQEGVYAGYPVLITPGGRQVRRGSGFMRDLNERRCSCEGGPRCLSVFLSKDGIILPSSSAVLPCGYNLKLDWPVFHWGIVFSPRILETGAGFLKGRLPANAVRLEEVIRRRRKAAAEG
jgi:triacylglycerol esterase/lipase EstA (alpha/beta hydrolase family)